MSDHFVIEEVPVQDRDGSTAVVAYANLDSTPNDRPEPTPLPKLQLFIVFYIQLAEPIASTVIYPFVNQLVRDIGVTGGDQRKTGYFAGLIESAFYATEAICVLQWGRASDRLGRKPILLGGLMGMTLSMLGFGLSRQFWSVVLARCAEGALCGNIGVCKGMVAELTDASNMAQAFAYLPMVWTAGATLGPLIGGLLARPAERWPQVFGQVQFFTTYPYFLPCMAAACVSISAFTLAFCMLNETLPPSLKKSRGKQSKKTANEDLEKESRDNPVETKLSPMDELSPNEPRNSSMRTLQSLLVRRIVVAFICYAFLAFIDQCMVILQPLMYSSSISLGGLGFSSLTIGLIMGIWGVINGLFSIFAFPRMLRIVGARKLYIAAFASYLICLAAFPILGVLARKSGRVDVKVWIMLIVQLAFYMLAYMSYGCIFILVNEEAPRNALGALNGLAQTVASLMRAVAPSTASSLFAVSLEKNIIGGNLVYIVLLVIIFLGVVVSTQIPKSGNSR